MSVSRGTGKEDAIQIYDGIWLGHKKEWNNATFSNMDGLRDYQTKSSESDRERQIYITYRWYLKRWYKWTYLQTEIESQR